MDLIRRLGKWTTVVVVAVAIGLVGGGMMLSPAFSVTRSAFVDAPPDKVYALVADPRSWPQWSAWSRRDPAPTVSYGGPASGPGASWSWHGGTAGDGKLSFTSIEPGRRVAFDLEHDGAASRVELTLAAERGGTRVTWKTDGNVGANPLRHWIALFADPLLAGDADNGLASLKSGAEAH